MWRCGRIKFQVIPSFVANLSTAFVEILSSFTIPLKLVPQSLATYFGIPLRLVNLLKEFIKLSVSKPSTASRCIALVLSHVNKQPHLFSLELLCLIEMGPNKSAPVFENGGNISSVGIFGRSLIIGSALLEVNFRQ